MNKNIIIYLLTTIFLNASTFDFNGMAYDIDIKIYNPPLLVENSRVVSEEPLFWYDAYNALRNYRDYEDFNTWVQHFSNEYVKEFSITETLFNQARQLPKDAYPVIDKKTVVLGVNIQVQERKLYFIKLVNGWLPDTQTAMERLVSSGKGGSTSLFFEYLNGQWVNQTVRSEENLFIFATTPIDTLIAALEHGFALADDNYPLMILPETPN